jgi:hypothetical protein
MQNSHQRLLDAIGAPLHVFADSFEAIAQERARPSVMPGSSGLVCGTRIGGR